MELSLTIKRCWFDLIAVGQKTHEYRVIKQHWISRLEGKSYDTVVFRNGYSPDAPTLRVKLLGVSKCVYKGEPCYDLQLGGVIA